MSIELRILASGSSGNCTVVRGSGGVMLIDCGIGPRTAAGRMKDSGVVPGDISAVVLTHLDRDHFNPNWIRFLTQRGIPVFCHENRANHLRHLAGNDAFNDLIRGFDSSPFEPVAGLSLSAIPLAHDQEGSHGFIIESASTRAGYATDLGHVPDILLKRFRECDILGLESNYDPLMQEESGRPLFLRRRIMGGRGHLSNQQAFEAVTRILDSSRRLPRHIVLLHRSRQCNCPRLLREFFSRDARIAARLTLAEQDSPTPWLKIHSQKGLMGKQMELAFG